MSEQLTCKQLVMLITDYVEGVLPEQEHARFDAHLATCEHCAEYLSQLRTTIQVVGRLREDDLEPATREGLLAAFRDWKSRPA